MPAAVRDSRKASDNRPLPAGDGEFCGCTALKAVDIPNSVLTIGGNAFQRCSNLVSAKIGDGVQEISYHVFTDCSRLEKVILGAGITSIGMRTFGSEGIRRSGLSDRPPGYAGCC